MKVEVETPERGVPWSVQYKDGFTILVIDPSLTEIRYVDDHGVIVETKQ